MSEAIQHPREGVRAYAIRHRGVTTNNHRTRVVRGKTAVTSVLLLEKAMVVCNTVDARFFVKKRSTKPLGVFPAFCVVAASVMFSGDGRVLRGLTAEVMLSLSVAA